MKRRPGAAFPAPLLDPAQSPRLGASGVCSVFVRKFHRLICARGLECFIRAILVQAFARGRATKPIIVNVNGILFDNGPINLRCRGFGWPMKKP